jgi:membrane fusion protein (multidrug efflux system)
MWFRRISLIAALVLIAAGFGVNKMLSARKQDPPRRSPERGAVAVQVLEVANGPVYPEVQLSGRVNARQRVEVFAEVSGRLLPGAKRFREGVAYRQGEPLLRLDDSDQRQQLSAQRAALESQLIRLMPDLKMDHAPSAPIWQNYLRELDPARPLPPLPETSDERTRNFLAVNNIYNQYYSIAAAEAQLAKFTVYAPFSGVITQGELEPGNLVRAGVKLGEFLNPDRYELEAAVQQSDLSYVRIGQQVQLRSEEDERSWTGVVERIGQSVDPGTQTVKVFIRVDGRDLRGGAYLSGNLQGAALSDAVAVERALINDQQSLWVVGDSTLQERPVEVLAGFGKMVAVRGLQDGDLLVSQRIPSAYAGMPVRAQR